MYLQEQEAVPLVLKSGACLPSPGTGRVWRLESGALRINNPQADGQTGLLSLALPGDRIGLECLAGLAQTPLAFAITPAVLIAVEVADSEMTAVMKQAYLSARQRCADMVMLRTGSVPNRVRYLLLLLADSQQLDQRDNALPCLRDMAQVVDASIETVSRVLGGLRQFDLLQGRRQQGGTVNAPHLRQFTFLPGMTSSSALGRPRCAQA